MTDDPQIEIIARGVALKNNKLLLCFNRKSGVAYLPGGHIDFGECGRAALEREILEEIGCESHAGKFLGCCEHFFVQNQQQHAEVNLIYQLDLPTLNSECEVPALEDWIGFIWQPVDQLDAVNFQPAALQSQLLSWTIAAPGHLESGYSGS